MHKVFISYHHDNDQWAKDELLRWNQEEHLFIDKSVDTGDISDDLDDETIRVKIRDDYLQDSTVTILLVGRETQFRKHVDWELYSSMRDSARNKKSGIIVVMLPDIALDFFSVGHGEDEKAIYPPDINWVTISDRTEYEARYPYMPERIIDNLVAGGSHISVVKWEKIASNHAVLRALIEWAHRDKEICKYDLSRPMRRRNA